MPRHFKSVDDYAEYFWSRVKKIRSDCWIWQGKARSGSLGYAAIRVPKIINPRRPPTTAHRMSFFLTRHRWPENTRHKCDTPLCVRPKHLIEGTQLDNVLDCIKRGRARNGNIKLNPHIWRKIRQSKESSSVLAKRYGVCESHIRRVRRGMSGRVYRP